MEKNIFVHLAEGEKISRAHFRNFEITFDLFKDLYFFVKDDLGSWVTCNEASLLLLGLSDRKNVTGLREIDFFPVAVANSIELDDAKVLKTGQRIIDRVELIANERGQLVWVKTVKVPILDQNAIIRGLLGLTHLIPESAPLPGAYERFRGVVRFIEENIDQSIRMEDLASLANLSVSHFRRAFKERFSVSPQEFIIRFRMQAASYLLATSGLSIAQIALECGFSSQSHFNRHFTRFFEQPPNQYRQRWRST